MRKLELIYTSQFEKDFRKIQKQHKKLEKLHTIISTLVENKKLETKYRDHILKGNYVGYRECHIEPDWLLIYKTIDTQYLELARTGSHSELF